MVCIKVDTRNASKTLAEAEIVDVVKTWNTNGIQITMMPYHDAKPKEMIA
jgi:hypothetical protein